MIPLIASVVKWLADMVREINRSERRRVAPGGRPTGAAQPHEVVGLPLDDLSSLRDPGWPGGMPTFSWACLWTARLTNMPTKTWACHPALEVDGVACHPTFGPLSLWPPGVKEMIQGA